MPDDRSLLKALPISDAAKSDLLARMTAPDRHYHDLGHIELLWRRHLEHAAASPVDVGPFGIRIGLAIAYHDSVYVGGARDNEARSAALWLDVGADLDETGRHWVAETIRATADHIGAAATIDTTRPEGYARQWVLDLDLTPLGETPDLFDRNMDLLRAEDPQADLAAGIRYYAAADELYRCAPLAGAFTTAARANLLRHLRHDVEES